MSIETGIKGCLEKVVGEEMSAANMGSGELSVCATPAIAALVEETAWRSIADDLEEGMTTVGTRLELDHIAATPIGMKLRCETELTANEGRRYDFSFEVFDEVEKVAEGTHTRFVVDGERFLKKAGGKQH